MKYLKRVKLPIICLLITSFTVPGTAHSVAFKLKGSVQSVVFKQEGAKYIYSNNPEPVKPEMVAGSVYGQYTIEQVVYRNTGYDCEFTHGNRSYTNLSFGVAVVNKGTSPGRIRVVSEQVGYVTSGLDLFSRLALDYQLDLQDGKERVLTVPPGSAVILMSSNVPHGNYVTGKMKFFVTGAADLTARVFWVRSDKLLPSSKIFDLPRASAEPDPTNSPWARTSGFFDHDYRTTIVDTSVTRSVYLGGLDNNPGEYERAVNVLGNPVLRGNYGVTYDFTLKSATGKKIRITPNLYDKKAQILLWDRKNGWYRSSLITTASRSPFWLIDVPEDGRFRYLLPAMNCGNILFEFGDFTYR